MALGKGVASCNGPVKGETLASYGLGKVKKLLDDGAFGGPWAEAIFYWGS